MIAEFDANLNLADGTAKRIDPDLGTTLKSLTPDPVRQLGIEEGTRGGFVTEGDLPSVSSQWYEDC